MELYGQAPDVHLLSALLRHTSQRTVIDVGAERGDVTQALLDAGAERVFAIEPAPANVAHLRERFGSSERVVVLANAVSSDDGVLELHASVSPDGAPVSYGHTALSRPATEEIAWSGTFAVEARRLETLIASGALPRTVGILKVDTEGHDLEVLKGMGPLGAEVVVVEHWQDLPRSLGPCPWTIDDLRRELDPRGFNHFAFVIHRDEFVYLQWDDARVPPGSMGNVVFLHDSILAGALPTVLSAASELAVAAVTLGEERAHAATDRLEVIDELTRDRDVNAAAAAERLALLEECAAARKEA